MLFEVPNVVVPLLPAQCLDRQKESFFISLPVILTGIFNFLQILNISNLFSQACSTIKLYIYYLCISVCS